MKQVFFAERFYLIFHILAMAFGLAGLLLVLPHPELIAGLSDLGQTLFSWGMSGGGVVYIILGAIAASIYAYRILGLAGWLGFLLPSVLISLSSELLGTSTGFPFGHYAYLSGLGYKIAGLVPFTIPLSWFYLGFASYVLARKGLEAYQGYRQQQGQGLLPAWVFQGLSVSVGALLLTSWDFVLDPAMSQTTYPFWHWLQPGAFFGMPYQNFAGWWGTGAVFMSVAALIWEKVPAVHRFFEGHDTGRGSMEFPILLYLSDFAFATVLSVAAGIWVPIFLGLLLGVGPALACYWMATNLPAVSLANRDSLESLTAVVAETVDSKVSLASPAAASVKVSSKV